MRQMASPDRPSGDNTLTAVNYARRASGASIGIALAAILGVAPAASSPLQSGAGNPWAIVAPALFNDEEHFLETNEFDLMDDVQLAAVPKGQRIKWSAPSNCVPGSLKTVLSKVAAKFGPITVNSTARSRAKNARVGGRTKSFHLGCRAVDFRVHGSSKGLIAYLAAQKGVGGIKRYSSGFYHIDNGPRRSW
jgi:Peptidase M15